MLDIETTGLSPTREEITEVAVIRVNELLEVEGEMSALIRIGRPVPWYITRITGITDDLLDQEGRSLVEVLEEAHGFLGGSPVLAHNARFDRSFLDASASGCGLPFRFPLECSIPVFKRLLPGRKGYGLPVLAEALRVEGGGAHRAMADCLTLLECLREARRLAGGCSLPEGGIYG